MGSMGEKIHAFVKAFLGGCASEPQKASGEASNQVPVILDGSNLTERIGLQETAEQLAKQLGLSNPAQSAQEDFFSGYRSFCQIEQFTLTAKKGICAQRSVPEFTALISQDVCCGRGSWMDGKIECIR